jgi:hypothetical protein
MANGSGSFVSTRSNRSPILKMVAPGENVVSSSLFNTFQSRTGSGQAAAHVAGGWALLKNRLPDGSVDTLLTALQRTGDPVIDPFQTGRTFPRIVLDRAAGSLGPAGSPTSVLVNTWAPHDRS